MFQKSVGLLESLHHATLLVLIYQGNGGFKLFDHRQQTPVGRHHHHHHQQQELVESDGSGIWIMPNIFRNLAWKPLSAGEADRFQKATSTRGGDFLAARPSGDGSGCKGPRKWDI